MQIMVFSTSSAITSNFTLSNILTSTICNLISLKKKLKSLKHLPLIRSVYYFAAKVINLKYIKLKDRRILCEIDYTGMY